MEETYAVLTRGQRRAVEEAEQQQQLEEADAQGAATRFNCEEMEEREQSEAADTLGVATQSDVLESGNSMADVPVELATAGSSEEDPTFNFEEEVFGESRPPKVPLSRAQKRAEARRRTMSLPAAATTLEEAQKSDVGLQYWRSTESSERIREKNGLLYIYGD